MKLIMNETMPLSPPVKKEVPIDELRRLQSLAKNGLEPLVTYSESITKMREQADKRRREALNSIIETVNDILD